MNRQKAKKKNKPSPHTLYANMYEAINHTGCFSTASGCWLLALTQETPITNEDFRLSFLFHFPYHRALSSALCGEAIPEKCNVYHNRPSFTEILSAMHILFQLDFFFLFLLEEKFQRN